MPLEEILARHEKCFSRAEAKGPKRTDLVEMDITLERGAKPVRVRNRKYSPRESEAIRKGVADMLEAGVIEESTSPWPTDPPSSINGPWTSMEKKN